MSKLKLRDKKLLNQIYTSIGITGSAASIIALSITLPGWYKLFAIFFVLLPIVIILIIYLKARNKKSATFRINQVNIKVMEGDIFQEDNNALNVIPFNEYYDVIVDDSIIAENSLHGLYIKKKWLGKERELHSIIQNDLNLAKQKNGLNENREIGNKQKYNIGSVVRIDNFVLTAFSKFDESNRAYLSFTDYMEFLLSFWDNIDKVYACKTINIPVFGSGITRIGDKRIPIQQLIETIIWSIKDSGFQCKNINILVFKDDIEIVDFYHLEPIIY